MFLANILETKYQMSQTVTFNSSHFKTYAVKYLVNIK